ncbi:MAG: Uncharacterised protein [Euryarchaeota archaeon UBA443]|nr:MAG: Uncharacterised protein [Euryarchaeota archaeon UBA443]
MTTEPIPLRQTIGLMHENEFGKFGENMKTMLDNQEGSARSEAGIIAMSMFFAGLLVVAFTTNPIASGTQIGERAPVFSGEAYDGTSWKSFQFDDLLDMSWTWNATEDVPWIAVEFLDTDCGHCKNAAPDMATWSQEFSGVNGAPNVVFIAIAVEFVAESSRAEIVDFRTQYENNFLFVDDLDEDIAKDWDVLATPSYFLVQPDGIVAWNSGQATNSIGWDAKEEKSIPLNGFDDGYVQLNEAIVQLMMLNGGE